MAATGVVPDIDVEVTPSDEKIYYEDPFAAPQVGIQGSNGDRPESPQINRCVDSATAKPSWFAIGVKVRPRMVRRHARGLNLKFPSSRMRPCCELSIC
jgi:hypothetical protein